MSASAPRELGRTDECQYCRERIVLSDGMWWHQRANGLGMAVSCGLVATLEKADLCEHGYPTPQVQPWCRVCPPPEKAEPVRYPCALCSAPLRVGGDLITVNVEGHSKAAHRQCPPEKAEPVACEWCGTAIYHDDGRWLAVKGAERGYDPAVCCDNHDDGTHNPGGRP